MELSLHPEIGSSCFLGNVGDLDIHDATIRAVELDGANVRVLIDADPAWGGRRFTIVFHGVERLHAHRPEGMLLYALGEVSDRPPRRRFVFINWYDHGDDDQDDDGFLRADAALELSASGFTIHEGDFRGE